MQPQKFSNEQVKQVFFILLIVGLGYILFVNLKEFLPSLLGAITIYILARKLFYYVTEKLYWQKGITTILFIFASFLLIVVPITGLIEMLTGKASYILNNKNTLLDGAKEIAKLIKLYTNYDILGNAAFQKFQETSSKIIPQIFGATFNIISVIGIMFFILFFMFQNGKQMESFLYDYMPLKAENAKLIGKEVNNMVLSNAIGIPVIAILQSIIALIGYYIFGIKDPIFWFGITCFTSMIPIIGNTIVWIPLAVQLLITGNKWQGIGLLIWGVLAIAAFDNVFRIILTKKIGDTHPLITIFGVIIGVKLYGFIGLIFGPLLISLFILLLKIYANEYFIKKRTS